jgi:cytochrome c oxidase subunit 1
MKVVPIAQRLGELPAGDRWLLRTMVAMALFSLALGVGYGLATALARTGQMEVAAPTGYRLMTGHGVTIFFYWLYFAQFAVLTALLAARRQGAARIVWKPLGWTGLAFMAAGLAASQIATFGGEPLLYDGSPELVGESRWQAGLFYCGYVALALGMCLLAAGAIASAIAAKTEAGEREWSTAVFAIVAWAGLVIVSGIATVYTFAPAAAWTFGWGPEPANHATGWHLLFHNLHYLPLMGTVIAWYAIVEDMTGVGSIFGRRFSKAIFTLYLVFVPPTSLYHMFLDPNLAPVLRGVGSLLSLFISVPTIAVFLVIVSSLEAHARARGARGLFGWLRMLPWREPAMAAFAMAVANLALGGILAFVLIQEKLAPLLSDTFFVPAYFHFLTIGTVTLTLLGAISRLTPALFGRPLLAPRLLAGAPYAATAGIALFGGAGMAAGLSGMPRRTLDVAYDGAAPALWGAMSPPIAAGAAVMALALLLYVALLAGSALRAPSPLAASRPALLAMPQGAALRQTAWTAPLCVVALVGGMYLATALAFALLRALPLAAAGGATH